MLDEVPNGWDTVLLSNVAENITNQWLPNSNDDLEYIGLEHIAQGDGILVGKGSSTEVVSNKNRFSVGDVLFGKLRPNLRKTYLAEGSGICSTDILVIRPKSEISGHFLFFLLSSDAVVDFAVDSATGTKMPRTSWKALKDYRTPLPPLSEQQRIAEILTSVDDTIRATEAVIAQTERVKLGVMEDLLTGGLGSEAIANGEVPDGWDVKKLPEIAKMQRGKFSARPRNDPKYYDGRMPFLQTGDIANADRLIETYSKTLNELGLTVSKCFPSGTIMMAIAANVGDVAISAFEAAYPDSVVAVQPNSGVDQTWLFQLLRWHKQDFADLATSNAQANLSLAKLHTFKVMVPPHSTQIRIGQVLTSFDDKVAANKSLLSQTKRLKQGLMSDLLTGKKRVV
jgi:type I restriction enzyme S subunit